MYNAQGEESSPDLGGDDGINAAKTMIDNGASMQEIRRELPVTSRKYRSGIEKAHFMFGRTRTWQTDCIVYYGPPGTGKTQYAEAKYPNAYIWNGSKWFDGYDGQEVVLVHDFEGELVAPGFFKRLVDHDSCTVEVKKSHVRFIAKVVVVTTNTHPSNWFRNFRYTSDDQAGVLRRISHIYSKTAADGEWVDIKEKK